MHAREDEEKHGFVESKNKLDATIFTGEKTLKDFADKIKPDDKAKIEEKLKAGKELLTKADVKKDEFDKFTEELNQILQVVGQAVYGQPEAGQPGPDGQPAPEDSKKSGDKKTNSKDKEPEEGEIVK